ncbi:MAG: hypothetical protein ABR955_14520, partial [Verrucomicrobiota bacterium]
MSRSTNTNPGNGGQLIINFKPAFSALDRNTLANSAVNTAKSVGSKDNSMRPASILEKSSSVLTSFKRRRLFRWANSRR